MKRMLFMFMACLTLAGCGLGETAVSAAAGAGSQAEQAKEALKTEARVKQQTPLSLAEIRELAGKGDARLIPLVTLFEFETLVALKRDCNIELGPEEHRRNVTTEGVPRILVRESACRARTMAAKFTPAASRAAASSSA